MPRRRGALWRRRSLDLSCTNTLRIRSAEKQLFRDTSKQRHLMHFDRFAYEKVAPRVGFPSRIVLVIFANFCEKDSSSCHGVRREGPSAQKTPKTEHFAQKLLTRMMRASSGKQLSKYLSRSQRSLRGKHLPKVFSRFRCRHEQTIALRRMILHLAIAELRPKPVRASVFLKNRQRQWFTGYRNS